MTQQPDTTCVVLEQVGVRLGDDTLLAPVSLALGEGRTLAVSGRNGTGKTTLLRVLAGLLRPSSGRVLVAGRPVDERDPAFRRRVAALVGTPALARNLTLREHLVLVATSWGASVAQAQDRADELLDRFGIARLASRFPHEVSSGQAQLHSLALTLARPGELLLLDEPEHRLDADRIGRVVDVLRDLAREGRTVVLASHSAVLIEAVATDRLELQEA